MKNIVLGLLILPCALIFAFPSISYAQAPFGGLVVAEIFCTCSPFTWQWLTPLYLGGLIPTTGALAVPDAPFLFANYWSYPHTWVLGLYTPGVQACQMYVGLGCITLPTLGTMTSFTGSSL